MLRVAEIFRSLQGEGLFAGTTSLFLRTTGCNLRCWFCDTPYTSWEPEGHQRPWKDVLDELLADDCQHVVITGGEPLLQPNLVPLTHELHAAGRIVTIETAGTVYRPVAADLMSISPKLSNSQPSVERSARWAARHASQRCNRPILHQLIAEYPAQLKFVIDQPSDITELEEFLDAPPPLPRDSVWVMPQARTNAEIIAKSGWLLSAAEAHGFRYSSRLHIEMFGNVRGR
ncbi:MAG: queE [Planctomycetaceae bacterium]|nr:queE [Planctomycetaceae bacterium]